MDEERGRIRSLLPLVVGIGGLGLAVAMIVDGVQKHATVSRLKQPVEQDILEDRAEDASASPTTEVAASLDEPLLDEESLDDASLAEEAPKEVPAPKEIPLSKLDKRLLYKQAYEKARLRAPVDPRASMVARFQST